MTAPTNDTAEPTSASPTPASSPASEVRPGGLRGLTTKAAELAAKLPNPISQRQPCVVDLFDYSATGDYTAEPKSTKRNLHYGYTMLFAAPLTILFDLLKYAIARPERAAYTTVTVGLFVLGFWLL